MLAILVYTTFMKVGTLDCVYVRQVFMETTPLTFSFQFGALPVSSSPFIVGKELFS